VAGDGGAAACVWTWLRGKAAVFNSTCERKQNDQCELAVVRTSPVNLAWRGGIVGHAACSPPARRQFLLPGWGTACPLTATAAGGRAGSSVDLALRSRSGRSGPGARLGRRDSRCALPTARPGQRVGCCCWARAARRARKQAALLRNTAKISGIVGQGRAKVGSGEARLVQSRERVAKKSNEARALHGAAACLGWDARGQHGWAVTNDHKGDLWCSVGLYRGRVHSRTMVGRCDRGDRGARHPP